MSSSAHRIADVLLARDPPRLYPSTIFDASLTPQIDALSSSDPVNVRSALHLLNDDIAHAHDLAQGDEGDMTSDYLHAQLHRREGDYWNSKVRPRQLARRHRGYLFSYTVVAWHGDASVAPRP